MNRICCGQKCGREKRVADYGRRFAAKVVSMSDGRVLDSEAVESAKQRAMDKIVAEETANIRLAISAGIDHIICSSPFPEAAEAIRQQLTAEELEHVSF